MIHRTAQTPSVLALFAAAAKPAAATRPATPGATLLRRCTLGLVQAAALVAVGVALPAQAQAPLPYQGRLDRDGKPQNGFFDLRFSIFTTSTGGTAVWSEPNPRVQVVAGAFSVRLGATQPIGEDVLANPTLYLQVEVKLPSEQNYITLLGRQQLMHAPYARSSTGDFRVGGKLTVGAASDAGVAVSVTGAESNGTTQGAVLIASGTSALVIDGDEIDSNQQLKLQSNTGQGVAVSGGLRVNGDLVGNANITVPGAVTAANTWVKIVEYDVSGNSTGGINVTPGPYRFLKVFFQGQLTAAGVDRRILLRFNNATTNYASYEVYDGSPYGNDTENTGIYLMRTVYGIDCDFALEWTVSLDQNHRKTVFGNGMIGNSSGHYSGFVGGGWWSDTSPVNFISLSVTPNAWPGWMYGHLIVYGIL